MNGANPLVDIGLPGTTSDALGVYHADPVVADPAAATDPNPGYGSALASTVLNSSQVTGADLKPWQRITQLKLQNQIRRDQVNQQFQVDYSLPAITKSIEDSRATQQQAMQTIADAQARLAAPPPLAPTHPDPNLGENIGGALAAILGGSRGAPTAVADLNAVAMDRQTREFANSFRKYGVGRDNDLRTLGMAREDQLNSQGRQDALSRELRAAIAQKGADARTFALAGMQNDQSLDLGAVGLQNDHDTRVEENGLTKDRMQYASGLEGDKMRLGLSLDKEKMQYSAKIDRETDALRSKNDEASKRRLMEVGQLWDTVNKDTDPNAVGGALDRLNELGIATSGRLRDGYMADAKTRADIMEREMATREKAVENRDPANRIGVGPTLGQQIEITKAEQDGYDMSGVKGLPGTLPPADGATGGLGVPVNPMMGGAPALNPAGMANRFNLRGPALTAKSSLDGIRASHQALLAQNPYPNVLSQKDADTSLSLSQRKQWKQWNDQAQTSARQLASARAKYLDMLPRPAKQAMAAMADQTLARIKALGEGASKAVNADTFREMQRKARVAFEDTYGVDPDTAKRAASR